MKNNKYLCSMKKIIIFLLVILGFYSCSPIEKKQYNFEIVYTNGDTATRSYIGFGDNMFSLRNTDLTTHGFKKTLVSGVRSYRITSIQKLGVMTKADKNAGGCGCGGYDLILVPSPEKETETIETQ